METAYDLLKIKSNCYVEMRFAGLTHPEAVMYMALLDLHEDGNEWLTTREAIAQTKSYVSDPYRALRSLERKGIAVSSEIKPYVFSAFSMYSAEFQELTRKHREERFEQFAKTTVDTVIHNRDMKRQSRSKRKNTNLLKG